jgi:ribosome maturation factor RimP
MGLVDALIDLVEPVVGSLGVELVDVEHRGAVLRVVVDEDGGIGLDRLAAVTQAISRTLDERDPVPGRYTLEVSSPGLERPLRTPTHFARALGQKVAIKTTAAYDGERRFTGLLVAASDDEVTVVTDEGGRLVVPLNVVERARTVFEWGPGPKPGKGSKPGTAKRRADAANAPTARRAGSAAAGNGAAAGSEHGGPRRRGDGARPGGETARTPRGTGEEGAGGEPAGGTATVDNG